MFSNLVPSNIHIDGELIGDRVGNCKYICTISHGDYKTIIYLNDDNTEMRRTIIKEIDEYYDKYTPILITAMFNSRNFSDNNNYGGYWNKELKLAMRFIAKQRNIEWNNV